MKATCIIEGQYALTRVQNWPAQMQLCGPTGGSTCSGNSYNPGIATLTPSKVTYNTTSNRYTAEYTFTIDDAWKGQPITHRYFLCLYKDANANVVQKSGASIDVVRAYCEREGCRHGCQRAASLAAYASLHLKVNCT